MKPHSHILFYLSCSVLFFIIIAFATITSCNSVTSQSPTVVITDMAGRRLHVPPVIEKIAANGSSGAILLYTLADELMIARNSNPSEGERQFCTPHYCNLPNIGSWFNTKGTRNNEEIIAIQPHLIVSAGKVDSATIKIVDCDQALMKIPMYLASTEINQLPQTYKKLGEVLHREEKATELIAFYEKYVPNVLHQSTKIEPSLKKRVYVAMDNDGLTTSPAQSLHSQVVEMAGGINVAQLHYPNADIRVHAKVSIEQVIKWDPDVILVCGYSDNTSSQIRQQILESPQWVNICAVRENRIIVVPSQPFVWIDRPPSVNQVIGLLWLAKTLYPQLYDYRIEEVVIEFYKKFYHCILTMEEARDLCYKMAANQ